MKRVLVIAYYFPPMGLSGVQRIAKFVKYLPQYGWEPTVLTVEPGGYFAFDPGLEQDVQQGTVKIARTRSMDPTRLFKKNSTVSLPAESSRKWLSQISQSLFVPDNKIGWFWPAVRTGLALHKDTPFDVILATIPPYTGALVARKIAKKTGVPFVVDYRDDWLDNPRHKYPTSIHRFLHRLLEKRVLSESSAVISINERIARRINGRIQSYFKDSAAKNTEVILQGFDDDDFAGKHSITNDGILTLVYSGVFYDAQTPDYFLQALAKLVEKQPGYRPRIRAVFVGLVPETSKVLAQSLGVEDLIEYTGYISHLEAIEQLQRADVLWMTVGKGWGQELISTSKLFEYMGTHKPILGLVPDGAAMDALKDYKACWMAPPDSVSSICEVLETIYRAWENRAMPASNIQFVQRIERKYLTGQLSRLLDASSSF